MVDRLQRPSARFPHLRRLPAERVAACGGDARAGSAGSAGHRHRELAATDANIDWGLQMERDQQENSQQLSRVWHAIRWLAGRYFPSFQALVRSVGPRLQLELGARLLG